MDEHAAPAREHYENEAAQGRPMGETSPVNGAACSDRRPPKVLNFKFQNVLKHGRFCCDLSCFEGSRIAKLMPRAVPRLALRLDGR